MGAPGNLEWYIRFFHLHSFVTEATGLFPCYVGKKYWENSICKNSMQKDAVKTISLLLSPSLSFIWFLLLPKLLKLKWIYTSKWWDSKIYYSYYVHVCSIMIDPFWPRDSGPPDASVNGIFQARILKWIAISYSRVSSQPRAKTRISWISRRILYHCATWEALFFIIVYL